MKFNQRARAVGDKARQEPLADNASSEGRAQNRRLEIVLRPHK